MTAAAEVGEEAAEEVVAPVTEAAGAAAAGAAAEEEEEAPGAAREAVRHDHRRRLRHRNPKVRALRCMPRAAAPSWYVEMS